MSPTQWVYQDTLLFPGLRYHPLHVAIVLGLSHVVSILLEQSTSPDLKLERLGPDRVLGDKCSVTPLILAIQAGDLRCYTDFAGQRG